VEVVGLGATSAIVKQSIPPEELATGTGRFS
jgi:hypothetical protein